jgi:hypothetical protein
LQLPLLLHALRSRGRIGALNALPLHSFSILLLRLCERRLPADHKRGKRYQDTPSGARIHVETSKCEVRFVAYLRSQRLARWLKAA